MGSVLDKSSMMHVIRAQFRAPKGRIPEGNILIDSRAGTTVIRKQFASDLGLQGKKERIDRPNSSRRKEARAPAQKESQLLNSRTQE